MNVPALSLLTGLCFEVSGAFLLAAEAIGLKRIGRWREKGLERASYVLDTHNTSEMARRADEERLRWLPDAIISLASGIGAALGSWLALSLGARGFPLWVGFLALIPGVLVGTYFIDIVRFVLRVSTRFLVWIEERAGEGAVGISGFTLLAIGFVLQFFGTLPAVMNE